METALNKIHDNEERNQVYDQCQSKGGFDLYRSVSKFLLLPDGSSFAVFDSQDIPAPKINKSEPIFNVRFETHLTKVTPLSTLHANGVLELG